MIKVLIHLLTSHLFEDMSRCWIVSVWVLFKSLGMKKGELCMSWRGSPPAGRREGTIRGRPKDKGSVCPQDHLARGKQWASLSQAVPRSQPGMSMTAWSYHRSISHTLLPSKSGNMGPSENSGKISMQNNERKFVSYLESQERPIFQTTKI